MPRAFRHQRMQQIDWEIPEPEIMDEGVGSIFSDIAKQVQDSEFASNAADTLLSTPGAKKALDKVKGEANKGAKEAVVQQIAKNAIPIMVFAAAGGALGGMVANSQKVGPVGILVILGLAGWAGWKIMHADAG